MDQMYNSKYLRFKPIKRPCDNALKSLVEVKNDGISTFS